LPSRIAKSWTAAWLSARARPADLRERRHLLALHRPLDGPDVSRRTAAFSYSSPGGSGRPLERLDEAAFEEGSAWAMSAR
jgi:hypothetical protein